MGFKWVEEVLIGSDRLVFEGQFKSDSRNLLRARKAAKEAKRAPLTSKVLELY